MDTNAEIQELKDKLLELENNWKRALADYKNLEKRSYEEKLAVVSFANSSLILKLLPVLDNLENLCKHLDDMGLKLTLKELKQTLQEEGILELDTQDKVFDSATMEAIEMIDGEEGKVLEVITKGYKLKDKLIRPARVKVGKVIN